MGWGGGGNTTAYLSLAALPSDAVTVENNFVMNADGEIITTIRPERMYSGFSAESATGLKSFVGDLSNLTTASTSRASTFYQCSALTTFIGDLSSLTHGCKMFNLCTSLTTFIGDLSALEYGVYVGDEGKPYLDENSGGMFVDTNLTAESVENIADSLQEIVADETTGKGYIIITWHTLPSSDEDKQDIVDSLSIALDKGWVIITDSELMPLFDSTKYQTFTQTVQPLDLDSEPQTVYCVRKK